MSEPLSAQTIAIVKATVPALVEHGPTITAIMYRRLFEDAHIRALFNHSNQGEGGPQVNALAAAILRYAQNIDNLAALGPTVERIAHKHIGYHILPEHYPYVATALLGAIKEVLGNAASEEVLTAWGEAYWYLASILKGRETEIRERIEAFTGGWTGWRAFEVVEKRQESAVITSFILRPTDGEPILRHKPGQYLTFSLDAPGRPPMTRNYSISCAPNDETYRISVKREARGQGGSRHLHDQVRVGDILRATPPAGDFYLAAKPQRPVVLLSGGVGLTPMVSIVETIAAHHPGLETHFVHGTMNSETHALDKHVRLLAKRHGAMTVSTFYNEPGPRDIVGLTHDVTGFITVNWLKDHVPLYEADIFLCGPVPFLKSIVAGLSLVGVAADRIHYEFFGPTEDLLAA